MSQPIKLTVACCLLSASTALSQVKVDFREAAKSSSQSTIGVLLSPSDPAAAYPDWGPGRLAPRWILMPDRAQRSGVAVAADLVVSCDVPEDEIQIVTHSGTKHDGTVVVRDEVTGLVVIRVSNATLTGAVVAAETPEPGTPVLVNSMYRGRAVTSQAAIIASAPNSIHPELGFTQVLDARAAAGTIGAPVFDSEGTLLGVMVVREGTALCLPAQHLIRLIDVASGEEPSDLRRGRLGVQLDQSRGAMIASVTAGTPAEESGLASGDRVVKINNRRCATYLDLIAAVSMSRAGDEVTVTIERGDETLDKTVVLAAVDSEPPPTGHFPVPIAPGELLFRLDNERRLVPLGDLRMERSELEKSLKKLEKEIKKQDEIIRRLREDISRREERKSGEKQKPTESEP